MAAMPWDERGPVVEEMARKRGNEIVVISEEEKRRWMARDPAGGRVLGGRGDGERGIDGAALLEDARALVAKHGQGVS